MKDITDIKLLLEHAKSLKSIHAGEIDEAYKYVFPSRQLFIGDVPPDRSNIFDTTAYEGVRELQTSIQNMLIPQSRPWVNVTFKNDNLKNELNSLIAEHLAESNSTITNHFLNSRFYLEIGNCVLDTIIAGTACMAIHDDPFEPITYECVPLKQISFIENKQGNVDCVFREHDWTARQLMAKFNNLPSYVTEAKETQTFTIVEAAITHKKQVHYSINLTKDWTKLSEKKMKYLPFIVWRWSKSNTPWGDSPVRAALPTIRVINVMQKTLMAAAEFASLGAWQTSDEGVNIELLSRLLTPGGIVPSAEPLQPIAFPGNYPITSDLIEKTKFEIRSILMNRGLQQNKNTYKTATEILAEQEMFLASIGAPARRLQDEALKPIATQIVSRLSDRGDIPKLTKEHIAIVRELGFDVETAEDIFEVEVNAAVKQVINQQQAQQDLMAYAQAIQVLPEEVSMRVNKDKFAIKLLRGFGFSDELTNSDEEVEEMKAQLAQLQQAQQAMSMAQQAGDAGGSINNALNGPLGEALGQITER
ncbi:hypothetical protein ABIE65_002041 [Constrictibacter sp. MBR-5]|jgi:hypothetical protein|uniref:portal protein n=1 Tax=Constrictibacter sp. MBR-5 TaxID=3156467 RepID=UPI0033923492